MSVIQDYLSKWQKNWTGERENRNYINDGNSTGTAGESPALDALSCQTFTTQNRISRTLVYSFKGTFVTTNKLLLLHLLRHNNAVKKYIT